MPDWARIQVISALRILATANWRSSSDKCEMVTTLARALPVDGSWSMAAMSSGSPSPQDANAGEANSPLSFMPNSDRSLGG